MTEPEESVLVEMVAFFNDMGWINESSQDAYDSLVDKVCDPSHLTIHHWRSSDG